MTVQQLLSELFRRTSSIVYLMVVTVGVGLGVAADVFVGVGAGVEVFTGLGVADGVGADVGNSPRITSPGISLSPIAIVTAALARLVIKML